jgi:hypothetical protein
VIGDDDEWSFEGLDELIEVLGEGKADIVRLGWQVEDSSRGKILDISQLIANEKLFFCSTSMISATIIRRSLVVDEIRESYQNISNSYPHLIPIIKSVNKKALVYTLSKNFMTHTPSNEPGYFFGDLEWYSCWFATSRYINDPEIRELFCKEIINFMTLNRRGFLKKISWLSKVAINAKGMGVSQSEYLFSIFNYSRGIRLSVIIAFIVYYALPKSVAKNLRIFYRKIKRQSNINISVDRSRL